EGGDHLEEYDGLHGHAAETLEVAVAGDAHHQGGEDQRTDDHLDQAEKDDLEWIERDAEMRPHSADDNARHQGDEDPRGQGYAAQHRAILQELDAVAVCWRM